VAVRRRGFGCVYLEQGLLFFVHFQEQIAIAVHDLEQELNRGFFPLGYAS